MKENQERDEYVSAASRDASWEGVASDMERRLETDGEITWNDSRFDVDAELARRTGVFVEVGGSTEGGYKTIDITRLPKKLFVSNLFPGAPRFRDGFIRGYYGTVDFRADARRMPMRDRKVGAMFCSCLGSVGYEKGESNLELREKTIREAWRLLEPGGLFFWEGAFAEDLKVAESLGFALIRMRKIRAGNNFWTAAVFQKPDERQDTIKKKEP